jgi:hypothetical protein
MKIDEAMTLFNRVLGEDAGHTNERENKVRSAHIGGDRYQFDFNICAIKDGWSQYDTNQDAWYFGVWVHVEGRITVTFAEGDFTLVECPTKNSFKAELADAAAFYGDPPPAFRCIDDDGSVTHFYDTRPTGE